MYFFQEYTNRVSTHCVMTNNKLMPISLPAMQILIHHKHIGWYSGSMSLPVRQILVHTTCKLVGNSLLIHHMHKGSSFAACAALPPPLEGV